MLHKCANPECTRPFRRLTEGKLFLVESPNRRRAEYYWLCDDCASVLTLTFEAGRGMITVPITGTKKRPPSGTTEIVATPHKQARGAVAS
jgi:hypothetical protein